MAKMKPSDSMFGNWIEVGHGKMTPYCPLCDELVTEGSGGAVQTPKGLFIIHSLCITLWNARAAS